MLIFKAVGINIFSFSLCSIYIIITILPLLQLETINIFMWFAEPDALSASIYGPLPHQLQLHYIVMEICLKKA
jgi:hypothetical protein